jgi:UDP-N-acetylmuramate--alanine ligase
MNLKNYHFHFVGIGGIGMCGLAELLHNMGARVSGSDLSENAQVQRMRGMGIEVFKGHHASQLQGAQVVVFSSAIPKSNPEISEAKARGIPLIPRAEALAEIMRLKRGVAVAGTHGKTTTTSLAASIFLEAGLSPTIFIGGRFGQIDSTAWLGQGEWLLAEADESDGSFQKLTPEISIITNIDSDHLDHFKSFENLENAFYEFALKTPFYGSCIVCGDDPRIRELFESFPKMIYFYGFHESNDFFLRGSDGCYEVFGKDLDANCLDASCPDVKSPERGGKVKSLGTLQLQVPGRHNALNALGATVAGLKAGISFDECKRGISKFAGVDRRFQFKGEGSGVLVYDDYGHHPTEVKATLQAFREKYPKNRIVAFFQPHRYSRTESCWHEFTQSFGLCDQVYITDIYPAGESPLTGVTAERLTLEIKHNNKIFLQRNPDNAKTIVGALKAGDVFVTLGAGDGWKLGLEVLDLLK